MTKTLEELREKIDSIDDVILEALVNRASLMSLVSDAKSQMPGENGKKIFDPAREKRILDRLLQRDQGLLKPAAVRHIFQTIIEACRNLQTPKVGSINRSLEISIQGIPGSFSEQAAMNIVSRYHIANYQLRYAVTSDQVLKDLNEHDSDYGIVAINNARGGLVQETIEALTQYPYRIVDTVSVLVRQSLLSLKKTMPEEIAQIYSHPQALKQCSQYLKKTYPQAQQIPWVDTAKAAVDLSAGLLKPHSAVIAHSSCALTHDLKILAQDIQDLGEENETLFFLLQAVSLKEKE
jgi:chorismate mutase